ncbi:MAG: hypothetical protein RJA99_3970 [Pseudomonadota bacterium]
MARDDTPSMAVFCDFENVALGVRDAKYEKFDIRKVLERLLLKGSIVVKKAYCDWNRYREFKAEMHEASFELIEIPHVRQSGKNSADIRMVVDALDLCYTKGHVDTFVIISGDSDFSPLVSKLRENAKTVIGVGVKGSTSDLLTANCDEFIFYDDLVREQRRRGQQNAARRDGGRGEAGRGEGGRGGETGRGGEGGRGEGARGDAGRGGDAPRGDAGRIGGGRGGNGRPVEREPLRIVPTTPPPVDATDASDDETGVGGPWRRHEPAARVSAPPDATDAENRAGAAATDDDAAAGRAAEQAPDTTPSAEATDADAKPAPRGRARRSRSRAAAAQGPEGAGTDVPVADPAAPDATQADTAASSGVVAVDAALPAEAPAADAAPAPKKRAPRRRKGAAAESVVAEGAQAEPSPEAVAVAPDAAPPQAAAPADDEPAGRESAEAEPPPRRQRTDEERRAEAIDLAIETVEALITERGADDKIWGSMVKQTLKRRRPGFAESYYGYRSFNELLEDARDRGLLALEHDEKSGGYVIRLL